MPYRRRREYRRARLSVALSLLAVGVLWLAAILGYTYSDLHSVGSVTARPAGE
jgi:hypothetical protein